MRCFSCLALLFCFALPAWSATADIPPVDADGLRSVLIRGKVIEALPPPTPGEAVSIPDAVSEGEGTFPVVPATGIAREPTPAASKQAGGKPAAKAEETPRDPKDAIRSGVRGRELRDIIRRWRDR